MAKPDFWGFISADNMTVRFLQCPREYCCHEEGSCEWRKRIGNASACQGNRDPLIPLCGGCLENYSQTIDTNACVENSKCGIRKNPRAVLLYLLWELVYWLCFDLYFLYQAQYKPVQKLLDGVGSKLIRFVRWTGRWCGCLSNRVGNRNGPAVERKSFSNSGAEAVVFYFYQLAMLVVPEGYSALATKADAALTAVGKFCNVEQPPGDNGVCIYAGMSGVHKLLIGLLTPVLMAVLLALMRQAFRVRSKETRGLVINKHDQEPGLQESLLSESSSVHANQPSVRRLEPAAADLTLSEEDEEDDCPPPADLETDSRGRNGGSMRETRPLLDAMACLVLFMYSSFAWHAIRLLNCVQVGDKLVLRYAGAQKCNFATWQAPIVLLVALLTAMPVFPIAAWGLSLKRMEGTLLSRRTRWARMSRLQAGKPSFLGAIARFAARPFVPRHWHWAFVLLLQRLLTVMCSALATTGVETSVSVALVSFAFLLLQMLARPYRLSWVNALQTCSNICLVTLAILNSASGAFLSTGFDPRTDGDATLRHFQTTLEVLMVLALFPPLLVYLWHRGTASDVLLSLHAPEAALAQQSAFHHRLA